MTVDHRHDGDQQIIKSTATAKLGCLMSPYKSKIFQLELLKSYSEVLAALIET